MRVLVVGGTGFIGYHTVLECLKRGYAPTVVALPPMPSADLFPPGVEVALANVNTLADDDVRAMLRGFDAVVYAAGVDDRVIPKAPAYRFFYEENVKASARFFRLAREANVKRAVLVSSYFATFARLWPELELTQHHPYIWSRVEQAEASFRAALPNLELIVLEPGYIFGSMPGRLPLWKPLIDYIASASPLFYTHGGTNMIAVENVAEAIVGAIEKGEPGQRYAIGDENLSWKEWLERLTSILGIQKRVITVPTTMVRSFAGLVTLIHSLQGRQSGLELAKFIDLQTRETFFDPTASQNALGYGHGRLDEALVKTVNACRTT